MDSLACSLSPLPEQHSLGRDLNVGDKVTVQVTEVGVDTEMKIPGSFHYFSRILCPLNHALMPSMYGIFTFN